MKKFIYGAAVVAALSLTACADDYLDTVPESSAAPETLFTTTDGAKLAVNGLARLMVAQYNSQQGHNGEGTVKTYFGEYMGNDYCKGGYTGFSSTANLKRFDSYDNVHIIFPWEYYYKVIANANNILAYIDEAEGPAAERAYLKAEALVYRAYSFFMTSQIYCKRWVDSENGASRGLPLRLDTSVGDCPCATLAETYAQVYKDLDEAIGLFQQALDGDVDRGTLSENFYKPNIDVARAIYARAALTRQDWQKAADMAHASRQGYSLMSADQYCSGFNDPNSEWIWGSYSASDQNLYFYGFFAYNALNSTASMCYKYPVVVSKELVDQIPESDVRRSLVFFPLPDEKFGSKEAFTSTGQANNSAKDANAKKLGQAVVARAKAQFGSKMGKNTYTYAYMSGKFQCTEAPSLGHINHIRASEMLLTEAEALMMLGGHDAEVQQMLVDLNVPTGRDPEYTCDKTGDDLLTEVKLYRRWDLWGEGFSFFDTKRWNIPLSRKAVGKGGSFPSALAVTVPVDEVPGWAYAIPRGELLYNSAITSPRE